MSDTITINLHDAEKKFLLFLSINNGEIEMSHDKLNEKTLAALDGLQRKGAITKFQLIGSSHRFQYKLTTIGISLVKLIREKSND